jgi:hypothetical protein
MAGLGPRFDGGIRILRKALIGAGTLLLLAVGTWVVSAKTTWLDGLRDQRKVLNERVETYWKARVAGDLDEVAKFAHPLQKGGGPSDMLITDSYVIEGVELQDDDTGITTVRVQNHLKQPQLAAHVRETVIKSKWVRFQGQWYQDIGPTNFKEVLKAAQRRLHPEEAASSAATASPQANKGVAIDEEPRNN